MTEYMPIKPNKLSKPKKPKDLANTTKGTITTVKSRGQEKYVKNMRRVEKENQKRRALTKSRSNAGLVSSYTDKTGKLSNALEEIHENEI